MAHHIAELIIRAENAPLPKRDQVRYECACAILDLWSRVRAFPAEDGPFESVDRVIEVVDSLHPDASPYYRNNMWRALEDPPANAHNEVESLLTAALAIDRAARNLIHPLLSEAARVAGEECAEWLELTQQLDDDDPISKLRVRLIKAGQEEATLQTYRIDQLQRRIEQLNHFAAVADVLKKSLIEALEAAQTRILASEDETQGPTS